MTPAPPFTHTGVDYAGPLTIKMSTIRNAKQTKAYVAVFVCFAVKAIHLEIVSDLTTEAFLACLDRFIARRGLPQTIHSDNATNFQGACNKLRDLYKFLTNKSTQQNISAHLRSQEIQWEFIPPSAPAFGGLWEAGVKSFKHHLVRVVGEQVLTFEELCTISCRIEAMLNSRPLTALKTDPNDLEALTPGHFLIGRPLNRDHSSTQANRFHRWERLVSFQQHMWARWSKEYLHQLQTRTKNYKDKLTVNVGQLVLVQNENFPPLQWPLGKIICINPGEDRLTRVAIIKTAKGIIKRQINKLAFLPIDMETQPTAGENVNVNS